jgi:hypothetical protein
MKRGREPSQWQTRRGGENGCCVAGQGPLELERSRARRIDDVEERSRGRAGRLDVEPRAAARPGDHGGRVAVCTRHTGRSGGRGRWGLASVGRSALRCRRRRREFATIAMAMIDASVGMAKGQVSLPLCGMSGELRRQDGYYNTMESRRQLPSLDCWS